MKTHPAIKSATSKGFTLIELMITVVIIGILAAIAYPSYTAHIVRSNRTAAQSFLMDVAQKQQQFFLDSRSYASTVADLQMTVPPKVDELYTVQIDLVAGPPPGFAVTATPKGGTAQASDVTLSINNAGVKSPAGKW